MNSAPLRTYLRNRFYFRGFTWLGILNTITACLFNRVLARQVDSDTLGQVGWQVMRGTDFPPTRDLGEQIHLAALWFFCKINQPIYSPALSCLQYPKLICAYCKKAHE